MTDTYERMLWCFTDVSRLTMEWLTFNIICYKRPCVCKFNVNMDQAELSDVGPAKPTLFYSLTQSYIFNITSISSSSHAFIELVSSP
jgi:hypothetical protein